MLKKKVIIIIIINIIIIITGRFFAPALADGFSLVYKWQQVFLCFLSILSHISNAVAWVVSIISWISDPCSKSPNYYWYYRRSIFPQLF